MAKTSFPLAVKVEPRSASRSPLLGINEPKPSIERSAGWLEIGFRPFYLLAAVFAALAIPAWVAQFEGVMAGRPAGGALVHAHEMIFGYTLAVIVGFLFTAGRNWTQRATPSGSALAGLLVLWVTARLGVWLSWGIIPAVASIGFAGLSAAALARPIVATRQWRNVVFPVVLLGFGTLDLLFHAGLRFPSAVSPWTAIHVALDLVLLVMVIMAGRVTPMFTNNSIPGADATRRPWIEKASMVTLGLVIAADLVKVTGHVLAAVTLACAIVNGIRLYHWHPWKVWRLPLVWVLHAAYGFIVLHLALRALNAIGQASGVSATHALSAGAIGLMTSGMMTRTAQGHSGRSPSAGRLETAIFLGVLLAACTRVAALVLPGGFSVALIVSATLWSGSFVAYVLGYWRMLGRYERKA